ASWSASSGVGTNIATTVSTCQDVSTGLVVGFHEEPQDEDGGFRWMKFEREFPAPLDQFLGRAFNVLLYVCNVIKAEHIRILLYGSRHRRRRYRRVNPNSRRNRRARRVSRLTADVH
ncbi:unnamed protein product, partial [Laminaria digitata]